jgi:chromosome segregation ATPase
MSQKELQGRFATLRQEFERAKGTIQTKSDQAERARQLELLQTMAGYNVDSIVKGLAELQLSVLATAQSLEDNLETESNKLADFAVAIRVALEQLSELRKVRVAADALFVLQQESSERLATLEREQAEARTTLEQQQNEARRAWAKADSEYAAAQTEAAAALARNRAQEEADHQYRSARSQALASDQQTEADRLQARDLSERGVQLDKDWSEREAKLAANQAKFEEQSSKVAAFGAELEEASKKAREEAIREATNEANVRANLLDKEWEGNKRAFELQIEGLGERIARGEGQLTELQTQLQTTLQQANQLASRAFKGGAA